LACKSRVATTTAKIVNSEKLCGREFAGGEREKVGVVCPVQGGRGWLQMSASSTKEFPVVKALPTISQLSQHIFLNFLLYLRFFFFHSRFSALKNILYIVYFAFAFKRITNEISSAIGLRAKI